MKNINETNIKKNDAPIKAVQFGEGNFLRAFADYMIDILNEKTDWNGSVVILKPIEYGSLDVFRKQDSVYTVLLRGLVDGEKKSEKRVITSCKNALCCYRDYDEYSALAKLESLRFVISNTTEAGIVYDGGDKLTDCPPKSYPAKLLKFLYERFNHFGGAMDKGLIILPVELIDDNGAELKRIVKLLASQWELGNEFDKWLNESCVFASTLVDRIVTGYPNNEAEEIFKELGYSDGLLVTGESFALWVIETDKDISGELPLHKAGLPVIFTNNHKPYKQRKVRILNGAHTSLVPVSFLVGNDYVGQSMDADIIRKYVADIIFDEIIPTLDLPSDELCDFAKSVTDRFRNPFIEHSLLSISLNGISKYKARCLPSLLEYVSRKKTLPKRLTFSLAAMAAFYNGSEIEGNALICKRNSEKYEVRDDENVLRFFAKSPSVEQFLGNTDFWGTDLNKIEGLCNVVEAYLGKIKEIGMKNALEEYFPL